MAERRSLFRGVVLLGCALACVQTLGQMPGIMFPSTEDRPLPPPKPPKPKKVKPTFSTDLPAEASLPPSFQIAATPLGFAPPPSSYYLGRGNSLVSLDFLDENHLLFSFHTAGLQHRDTGDTGEGLARQIRAVVIALPGGKVEAQASWTVPDRFRYLWMLKDGQFLLRTPQGLQEVNGKLEMMPLPQLQGNLLSLALDPAQKIIVTTSAETAAQSRNSGTVATLPMTQAALTSGEMSATDQGDFVVRATQRPSGHVLLTQRTHSAFNAPFNSDGYIDVSSAQRYKWTLTLKLFDGGSRALSTAESGCAPKLEFITDEEIFQTTCTPEGGLKLAAVSMSGRTIWASDAPPEPIWPLLVMSPDGSRLARESLVLKDNVNIKKHPKFIKAIKGQVVRVLDAGNGKVVFEAPLTPILDGGGNVAFSPSGRRFAILSNNTIQVFDLPLAAPIPDLSSEAPAH